MAQPCPSGRWDRGRRRHRRPRLDPAWRQAACRSRSTGAAPAKPRAARRLYVTLEPCSHHGKGSPPCAERHCRRRPGARRARPWKIPIPKWRGRDTRGLRSAGIVVRGRYPRCRPRRAVITPATSCAWWRRPPARRHPSSRFPRRTARSAVAAGRRPRCHYRRGGVRDRVHPALRAQSRCRSTPGSGTALADDPAAHMPNCPAWRKTCQKSVSCSTPSLRLPRTSRLVQTAREVPVWVVAGAGAARAAEEALAADGVVVLRAAERGGGPRYCGGMLKLIAARGITRLMVEGGPDACGWVRRLLKLVDEAVLFHSPTDYRVRRHRCTRRPGRLRR